MSTHCISGTLPPFSLHTVSQVLCHLSAYTLYLWYSPTHYHHLSAYTLYLRYCVTFQLTHCISGTLPPFSLHTVSQVLCHLSAYTLYLWYSSTFQLTHCISAYTLVLCHLSAYTLYLCLHTVLSQPEYLQLTHCISEYPPTFQLTHCRSQVPLSTQRYSATFKLTHCISGTLPPFSLHTVSLLQCVSSHLSAYTLYLCTLYSATFQLTHCISGTLPPFSLHTVSLVLLPYSISFSLHTVYQISGISV